MVVGYEVVQVDWMVERKCGGGECSLNIPACCATETLSLSAPVYFLNRRPTISVNC